MARQIAHRPRYRQMQHIIHASLKNHQRYFTSRWSYRAQQAHPVEKRAPGHSLSLIPLRYRLARQLVLYPL